MTAGRAMEEPCPDLKLVRQEVPHVADPYQPKAESVRSENIVTSRPEDGSLTNLGTSIQVPEPTALAEVADQVYETVLHEEVYHLLVPRNPHQVEVHVQDPKDDGVLETFQVLL